LYLETLIAERDRDGARGVGKLHAGLTRRRIDTKGLFF
jgi:hypothetical protein